MPTPAVSGPVIVQGGPSGSGAAQKKEGPTKIVIKQTVKQIQGADTKRRKKRVTKGNAQALKKKRKEYASVKKAVKKALLVGKKAQYAEDNAHIKTMKRGERVAARKKLKQALKSRMILLLKQLPGSGRLDFTDLAALISKIRRVKW